jgi:hypothetical protein
MGLLPRVPFFFHFLFFFPVCRFACSLLRQGMQQLIISLDTADVKAAEDSGDKVQISKVSKCCITHGNSFLISFAGFYFILFY